MPAKINEKNPEFIMRRAQLWGEVFAAKDKGQVLKVKVIKQVKGGYTVELPCGLHGFLHCLDKTLVEGDEMEARITVADYVSKEIKLKRVRDRKETEQALELMRDAQKNKRVIHAILRSVVKGGFLVEIMGLKAFIPNSQSPLKDDEAKRMLGQKIPVRLLKVSKKSSVASHKKALEQIGKEQGN